MSRKNYEQQIRELSNELTMATFISRGAIQENRELKTEIEELHKQNTALRTTERRLTTTEDQLEKSQERVMKKQARIEELEALTADLQDKLGEWEEMRKSLRKWMEQGMAFVNKEVSVGIDNRAGPSTPARRSRSRQVVDSVPPEPRHVGQTSSGLATDLFADTDTEDTLTPGCQRPSPVVARKKKRRFGEDEEEEADEPYNPSRAVMAVSNFPSYHPLSAPLMGQAAAAQTRPRSPLRREKRRPQIQLATIKVERPESDLGEASDDDPLGRY